jgi:hypothetical protein
LAADVGLLVRCAGKSALLLSLLLGAVDDRTGTALAGAARWALAAAAALLIAAALKCARGSKSILPDDHQVSLLCYPMLARVRRSALVELSTSVASMMHTRASW